MKKLILIAALMMVGAPHTWAADEITNEEQMAKEAGAKPEYMAALKQKYNLTDEQVKAMQTQGLTAPQMAIASQLAKASGKSLEDVLKMRGDGKMGWGKLAKELGVSPKEIGQSVSSLRHEINEARHADKMEARDAKKQAHRDAMADKHEAHQNDKASHGKGH